MPFHIQNEARNKKMCTETVPQQIDKTTIPQALPRAGMQKRNLNNPTENLCICQQAEDFSSCHLRSQSLKQKLEDTSCFYSHVQGLPVLHTQYASQCTRKFYFILFPASTVKLYFSLIIFFNMLSIQFYYYMF